MTCFPRVLCPRLKLLMPATKLGYRSLLALTRRVALTLRNKFKLVKENMSQCTRSSKSSQDLARQRKATASHS